MPFERTSRLPILRQGLRSLAQWRIAEKLKELEPQLKRGDTLLDIGSGNGVLCYELRKRGFGVTALDVGDFSFIESVKPVIYDGVRAPLRDDCADVALLITMLHHAQSPEGVLSEARRLARKIIVIEEIYSSFLERYMTFFIDSVFNLEFFGHPHTNKTDEGWRDAFNRLGLKLIDARYSRSLYVLRRATYVLERVEYL